MIPRSFLFVPADSERKLEKALAAGADALVLDLEDSVAATRKPLAREQLRELLAGGHRGGAQWWVRINPLDSEHCLPDLCAALQQGVQGIFLPKPAGASDLQRADHYLTALEAAAGLAPVSVRLMTVVESARGLLGQHEIPFASERLDAMTWGAEDLAADLGASGNRGPDGQLFTIHQLSRSFCLVLAAAGGFAAIDTPCMSYQDETLLQAECDSARVEGFVGKMAIHPDQIALINRAFSPSQAELDYARRVVEAFEQSAEGGTVGLDGRMLDLPHLKQARRTLARASPSISPFS